MIYLAIWLGIISIILMVKWVNKPWSKALPKEEPKLLENNRDNDEHLKGLDHPFFKDTVTKCPFCSGTHIDRSVKREPVFHMHCCCRVGSFGCDFEWVTNVPDNVKQAQKVQKAAQYSKVLQEADNYRKPPNLLPK